MPMYQGYWIDPEGNIIDLGGMSHIQKVIEHHERFGENLWHIKERYAFHGEPLGFEGHAREEILFNVIERGFIRIRENRNYWSIQL